jgi:hypothetical protein
LSNCMHIYFVFFVITLYFCIFLVFFHYFQKCTLYFCLCLYFSIPSQVALCPIAFFVL